MMLPLDLDEDPPVVVGNVESLKRLTRWKLVGFGRRCFVKSPEFNFGRWKWQLMVKKKETSIDIGVCTDPRFQPPVASFHLRTIIGAGDRPAHYDFTATDHFFSRTEGKYSKECEHEIQSEDRIAIDIEFFDMKKRLPNDEFISILPTNEMIDEFLTPIVPRTFKRGVQTDLEINIGDSTLSTHRDMLRGCSAVFQRKFDVEGLTVIEVEELSLKSFDMLLDFLYGSITRENFWKNRSELMKAANIYEISELRDVCERSLVEDIEIKNVLTRLQEGWSCGSTNLIDGCASYLFRFGQIHYIWENFDEFFGKTDEKLRLKLFKDLASMLSP